MSVNKNRKVLHLVSSDCEWEAAAHIASLAAALRDQGWQSAVTAPEHSLLDEFAEAAGVEAARFSLSKSMNPLSWMDLAGLVKNPDFSLVHVHDADAAAMTSRSGWFGSPKGVVVSRRELDTAVSGAEYGGGVRAIICSSAGIEEAFKKQGAPEAKIRRIYDGVNLAAAARAAEERTDIRIQYRDAYCPAKEKPLFLVLIAPLDAPDGQAELLEALPEILAVLPQTHLFIMGEGGGQPELERQIRIMALENDITILAPDRAYGRLQAAADIYLSLRSDDYSGFMVQSAMAAGRATLLSRDGCHPELVEDGKNGVLVPGDGESALKEALLDLLQNRSRREHLGRMAQAHAAKHFDIIAQAALVAEVYNAAASGEGGA